MNQLNYILSVVASSFLSQYFPSFFFSSHSRPFFLFLCFYFPFFVKEEERNPFLPLPFFSCSLFSFQFSSFLSNSLFPSFFLNFFLFSLSFFDSYLSTSSIIKSLSMLSLRSDFSSRNKSGPGGGTITSTESLIPIG